MSISSNRLSIAAELFSEELITWNCYEEVTDNSSKTDQEKGHCLMKELMSTINSRPQLITKLIVVLEKLDSFKCVAHKFVL